MTRRVLGILTVIILVTSGGIYAYRKVLPVRADDQGISYATAEVRRGDLTVGVTARGVLNPSHGGSINTPYPRGPMPFEFAWSFRVTEIFVKDGEPVVMGQPLLRLAADQVEPRVRQIEDELQQKRENLAERLGIPITQIHEVNPARGITLRAPIDGRITGLEISEGTSLEQGKPVARIVDDSRWVMTAKLTPWEFSKVKQGDKMIVRFADFAGAVEAIAVKVNPNPVPEKTSSLLGPSGQSSGSDEDRVQFIYWVTLEGTNPGLIQTGMRADIGIWPAGDEGLDLAGVAARATWLRYSATVDSYGKEELLISTATGIVSRVYLQEMELVKAGDMVASLSGEETQRAIEQDLEQIKQLETQLQALRAFTDELTVTSPMDGTVAQMQVSTGQQIEPWQWLGSIYDPARMQMYVQVDDVDVLHVQPGASVQVRLDALPGEEFAGRVMNVSTSGKDMSGVAYFDVWIEVQGSSQVRPGMQAEAYIEAGNAKDVLLVPLEAIFQEGRDYFVEVLESDGTARVAPVQIGLMGEYEAEIRSGLEEGQVVVTGSSLDLLPSQGAPDTLFQK
jgi:multidrug resistance efflux pump